MVAARVSEDPRIRVLLIESGPDYPNAEGLPEDLRNVNHGSFTDHDWKLDYTPTATSRTLPFTRGRVVGGSSAVNTAIAMRKAADLSFLTHDHLGSTALVTDSTGAMITRTRYFPYGTVRTQEPRQPAAHRQALH